jgi:hypothetical protein
MSQAPEAEAQPEAARFVTGGWVLVVAAFVIGFINFPLRVVGSHLDHLPGDALDNRLNNFILEHGYRYLRGQADSFWDAPAFYPLKGVTRWSDAHIGMLPFYAVFRVTGLSPEAAFQGWFLVPFVLNFVAAAWALRRLGAGWAGIAAGAYVFTFAMPLAAQLIHAQLFPRFLVPPAVVFGWQFLRVARTGNLLACLGCVVCQMYVSVYIGYFLVLLLAVGLVVTVIRFRSELPWKELLRPAFRIWLARASVLIAAGLTLLPLFKAHSQVAGSQSRDSIRAMAPSPRAWLTPAHFSVVAPVLISPNANPNIEYQLFPGFLPALAVCLGLFALVLPRANSRASVVVVAAWSVLLLALFVTRFELVWLYQLMVELPGGTSIRAISRVMLVLLFPIAVVLALEVDALLGWIRRYGHRLALLAGALAVSLVAADQWLISTSDERVWEEGRLSREHVIDRQNRIKDAIDRHPAPTLLYVFPSVGLGPSGFVHVQLEAMRAAQDRGILCVNGYSGYRIPGWDFFSDYHKLMVWLRNNHTPADILGGLVLVPEDAPGLSFWLW